MSKYFLLFLIIVFFSNCNNSSEKSTKTEQILEQPKLEKLYAEGIGVSKQMNIAMEKAKHNAYVSMAKQVGIEKLDSTAQGKVSKTETILKGIVIEDEKVEILKNGDYEAYMRISYVQQME